eukprot:scaffold2646_cov42-Cyclotella_meneghiniana.AAC.7
MGTAQRGLGQTSPNGSRHVSGAVPRIVASPAKTAESTIFVTIVWPRNGPDRGSDLQLRMSNLNSMTGRIRVVPFVGFGWRAKRMGSTNLDGTATKMSHCLHEPPLERRSRSRNDEESDWTRILPEAEKLHGPLLLASANVTTIVQDRLDDDNKGVGAGRRG